MQRMCTFALREKCPNISGPYFPAFGLNTGKYGPEIPPYLDTFHAVEVGNNSDPSSREDQEN